MVEERCCWGETRRDDVPVREDFPMRDEPPAVRGVPTLRAEVPAVREVVLVLTVPAVGDKVPAEVTRVVPARPLLPRGFSVFSP